MYCATTPLLSLRLRSQLRGTARGETSSVLAVGKMEKEGGRRRWVNIVRPHQSPVVLPITAGFLQGSLTQAAERGSSEGPGVGKAGGGWAQGLEMPLPTLPSIPSPWHEGTGREVQTPDPSTQQGSEHHSSLGCDAHEGGSQGKKDTESRQERGWKLP